MSMSTASKPTHTSAPPPPAQNHKFTFPPFPAVPEGVTLIPFKDFKEHGIQPFLGDDEIERDGLGIPTIALRTKHDTDVSKTNPTKSAMKKTATRNGFWRKEWWEDWEEGEDLRVHGPYDPNVAQVDRFHQAASDFQKYRKFPPASTNVQYLWDQFRIFAGLLSTTPVWQKTSEKPADDDGDNPENLSDDEDDFDSAAVHQSQNDGQRPKRLRPRAPYDLYGKSPTLVENNDEIQELLSQARAAKEDKVVEFLNDPARGVRVFLSSYMIYQGLVYADKNLTNAPYLLRFFLNYLLRARVFPADHSMERSLKAALEVVERAEKELPRTAVLARGLVDEFGGACAAGWGARGDCVVEVQVGGGVGEGGEGGGEGDGDDEFEARLSEGNVEVEVDDAPSAATIVEVNLDTPSPPPPASPSPSPTPKDEIDALDPELFVVPPSSSSDPASSWGIDPDADLDAAEDWTAPTRPSLLALLGATALPLTHTPGVVEWSVRRVKGVLMPVPASAVSAPPSSSSLGANGGGNPSGDQGEGGPDAEAVERALEARFARVVMGPWVGWDGGEEATQPARILRSSVGEVVVDLPSFSALHSSGTPSTGTPTTTTSAATPSSAAPATPAAASATAPAAGPLGLKPHNLLTDDITLLLDPAVAKELVVGMGVGGTWVQIARVGDVPTSPFSSSFSSKIDNAGGGAGNAKEHGEKDGEKEKARDGENVKKENSKPKKKKPLTKAQKERRGLRYWYLDDHMMVLPSYWLV
ncbi:hypothetical protein R3P38DRAFT_3293842 [Favolaschia claudopus]|uniref:Uncharacterized protein n=1 Tax=Favolaschia claudopus TaxID=2862362 RepID=A0AAV9ZF39_9AGAR